VFVNLCDLRTILLHPGAVVEEGVSIGAGTRVWAFAHILSGAIIGADCNICDHTFIEGEVRVGSRVTVKCGVSLWNGLILEDDVFVGPGAVFTNDKRPRSRNYPKAFLQSRLREGCSIGAGCVILPGLTIGRWAMIGAGAVVTHDVPDYAVVYGNPARVHGWTCRCGEKLGPMDSKLVCSCGLAYQLLEERQIMELGLLCGQAQEQRVRSLLD
jgi:UDP-2-acetamido-3-amino-2,3-dideoxy-glucuronate N-acetyltransferase